MDPAVWTALAMCQLLTTFDVSVWGAELTVVAFVAVIVEVSETARLSGVGPWGNEVVNDTCPVAPAGSGSIIQNRMLRLAPENAQLVTWGVVVTLVGSESFGDTVRTSCAPMQSVVADEQA